MANPRTLEVWVGVFVALGIAALFMLAMRVSNLSAALDDNGYLLTARFENIAGLKERAPVTMAGVNIGRVTKIGFDPRTYQAIVTMRVNDRFDNLPRDTSASILTAGLLGEKYIGMEPGGSDEVLRGGDEIELTQSSLVLEQLIGQFLFSKASEGGQ
ncbi:MAG: outer membrane lipid asymmetry maintenance protein MlaD [Thiohalomonadaceae bacterium]